MVVAGRRSSGVDVHGYQQFRTLKVKKSNQLFNQNKNERENKYHGPKRRMGRLGRLVFAPVVTSTFYPKSEGMQLVSS
jgi:hypothetical protein